MEVMKNVKKTVNTLVLVAWNHSSRKNQVNCKSFDQDTGRIRNALVRYFFCTITFSPQWTVSHGSNLITLILHVYTERIKVWSCLTCVCIIEGSGNIKQEIFERSVKEEGTNIETQIWGIRGHCPAPLYTRLANCWWSSHTDPPLCPRGRVTVVSTPPHMAEQAGNGCTHLAWLLTHSHQQ